MFTSPSWFAFAILAAPAAAPTAAPAQSAATQPAATQPTAAQPAAKANTAGAPEAAEPPKAEAKQASVDERLKTAEKLYKARKYVDSARELEGLWDDTKHPNALYNAALARFAAGHYAHTIAYLESYIADVKDAPQEALELAQFQLEKAKEKSAEVPVLIGPPEAVAAGAEIWVRRIPKDPKDTRPDMTLRVPSPAASSPATRSIYLDAGRWTVESRSKGFISQPQEVTIGKRAKSADPVNFVLGLDPKLRQVAFRIDVPPGTKVDGVAVELVAKDDGETRSCTIEPFKLNECKLLAEVGTWEVSASAPGFKPFRQVITLTRGQETAAFTLPMTSDAPVVATPEVPPEPTNKDVVPKRVRMQMAGGLNASGLPIFVTGLGLAVYGSNSYDRAINADAAECSGTTDNFNCRNDTIKAIRLRTAGLALVGTATGLFVTGLTAEFDVKPRVWYAELGTGAALLVGGASWLAATNVGLNRELLVNDAAPDWEGSVPNIDRSTNQRLAAAMFMGTGIGLVTGSTVGLLVRKRYEKRSKPLKNAKLTPFAPIGGGGLALSGRF